MSKKHPTGPEFLRMQRKLEIKKRKAKEEREKLRWFDANPDHPKTIVFREAAFAAAQAHIEVEAYKETRRERLIKSRLTVSMPDFAACFKLAPSHESGLVVVSPGARLEKVGPGSYRGRWKAYAMGHSQYTRTVVNYLRGEKSKPRRNEIPATLERRVMTVKLTHAFDRIQAVPLEVEHYPPLGAFETGAGYVAIFIVRSGQIIETGQTFDAACGKLKRPLKRIELDLMIWNNLPDAP